MQCVATNSTIRVFDRYDIFEANRPKHGALSILDLDPVASNEMAAVFDHLRRRKQRIASCVFQRGFEIRKFDAVLVRSMAGAQLSALVEAPDRKQDDQRNQDQQRDVAEARSTRMGGYKFLQVHMVGCLLSC